MKVHLLLCGQIRDLAYFEYALNCYRKFWWYFDAMTVVTWQEDLDTLGPGHLAHLADAGVRMIAAPRPTSNPMGGGSFVYQMSQLIAGLRDLPPGAVVLKSRPDMLVDWDKVPGLIECYAERCRPADGLAGLQRRIWVRFSHALHPFMLPDTVMLGQREDLLKIANMDASLTVPSEGCQGPLAFEEMRLWLDWFRRVFPVFDEYHDFICRADPSTLRNKSRLWLYDPRYQMWLGAYYELLRRYFLIGSPCYDGDVWIVRSFEREGEDWRISYTQQSPDGVNYDDAEDSLRTTPEGWMYFKQERWLNDVAPYFRAGAAALDPGGFLPDPEAVRRLAALKQD